MNQFTLKCRPSKLFSKKHCKMKAKFDQPGWEASSLLRGAYNDLPEITDYIPLNPQKHPQTETFTFKECEARHFALYKIF